jgi:hypothetical protein
MTSIKHLLGATATEFVCYLVLALIIELAWLSMPFMTVLKQAFWYSVPYVNMDTFYSIQR